MVSFNMKCKKYAHILGILCDDEQQRNASIISINGKMPMGSKMYVLQHEHTKQFTMEKKKKTPIELHALEAVAKVYALCKAIELNQIDCCPQSQTLFC